jgi:hypothetical protein
VQVRKHNYIEIIVLVCETEITTLSNNITKQLMKIDNSDINKHLYCIITAGPI